MPEAARMRPFFGRTAAVEKAEIIGSGLAIDIPFPANRFISRARRWYPDPGGHEDAPDDPRRSLRHRAAVSAR
jgi:hypothetical protein